MIAATGPLARPSRIAVRAEAARALSARAECEVLSATVRDGIAPPGVRRRLALLLNQLDRFDETIAVLDAAPAGALGHDEWLLLVEALFGRELPGDAERALVAARSAEQLTDRPDRRAGALSEQARALFRLAAGDTACALLREALRQDPGQRAACERLGRDLLRRGERAAALALADELAEQGVAHSALLSIRAMALAAHGRHEAARRLLGLYRFLAEEMLDVPDGFNRALAAELLANPAIRTKRHGMASVATQRIDSLVAGGGPLAAQLVERIVQAVQRRCDALGGGDHPWLAAMPRTAVVRSWCVITGDAGHERWHMHPFGWMSGVYYVAVPDGLEGGAGCLELGLPDERVDEAHAARVGRRMIRPRAGLLATFPSHNHHRTFAHGAAGKRICVAFDVAPG